MSARDSANPAILASGCDQLISLGPIFLPKDYLLWSKPRAKQSIQWYNLLTPFIKTDLLEANTRSQLKANWPPIWYDTVLVHHLGLNDDYLGLNDHLGLHKQRTWSTDLGYLTV